MFAYIETTNRKSLRRERRRAPFFVAEDFVYNRRPVYKVVIRGNRQDKRIENEITARFGGRVLFPESVKCGGTPERYRNDYEKYNIEVYIKSAAGMLRKNAFGLDAGSRVCIADRTGGYSKLLEEAAAYIPRLCVLTNKENERLYIQQAGKVLAQYRCAVPVFTSAGSVGKCALVIACDSGTLPGGKSVFSVSTDNCRNGIVPVSALPEELKCPAGIDPMLFSYAIYRFCGGEILAANAYRLCGGYKIPYNISKEKIQFLVK